MGELETPSLAGKLGQLKSDLRKQFSWHKRGDLFEKVLGEVQTQPMKRQVYKKDSDEFRLLSTFDPLREHAGL